MRPPGLDVDRGRPVPSGLPHMVARAAEPLPRPDDSGFARAFDRFGDARVVLLGSAAPGASEFCRARAQITRWLIEQRGFTTVALDADWADARSLDAYVNGREPPPGADAAFSTFPAWLMRNREVEAFLAWLRDHNAALREGSRTAICGLDRFGLERSMRAAIDHIDRLDAASAEAARRRFGCWTPWADEAAHERVALTSDYARAEKAVTAMLCDRFARLATEMVEARAVDPAKAARLAHDAPAHFRALYFGGADAQNRRARHLFETLDARMASAGWGAKAVVWAHNAQVGDARASEMGVIREQVTLGQLSREAWGREAALIGFGTFGGAIACTGDWDAPMQVRLLNPGLPDSWEAVSCAARTTSYLLDLRPGHNEDVRAHLSEPRLERYIGPVYRPETERWSHYAEGRLAQQYDAWVWFEAVSALTPSRAAARLRDPWPFGL